MLKPGLRTDEEVRITTVAPVFSLNKVIAGRLARLLVALVGAIGLLYLVVLIPGLWFLVLPGEMAVIGKVYDEARIIRFLKYGEPMKPEYWEETESSTEMIRINHPKLIQWSSQDED
ncbi:MAG: hypothetical protein ACFFEE_06100 [Candidatus Thorarchaeota archaeon]